MPKLSGGEMIVRALEDEGVEYIFGYPGGAALHIYDALFKGDKVPHILVRHEQAATHAADGYARATGKPGVVLVTSGPGATNAITGIATAYMDSIPLVVISGQVQSHLIGEDAFQETDMVGISRPIVKHSFLVQRTEDIPSTIKKAFFIASTGRPGPVVSFECELMHWLHVSPRRYMAVAKVVMMHVRDGLYDPQTGYIDHSRYKPLGRYFGRLYTKKHELFEMVVPSLQDWAAADK